MRILLLLALLALLSTEAANNWKVLHPCFERYANLRLVNFRPYHSEYRMGSEDHCLRFCVETASRCRSIVYENALHACHFFMDEGIETDMTVVAPRNTYFKVTNRQCLDRVSRLVDPMETEGSPVQYNPIEESEETTRTSTTTSTSTTTTTTTTESSSTWQPESTVATTEAPRYEVDRSTDPSDIDIVDVEESAPTETPSEATTDEMSRELQQMADMMDDVTAPSENSKVEVDKVQVETKLREKMRELRHLFPEKYKELVESGEALTTVDGEDERLEKEKEEEKEEDETAKRFLQSNSARLSATTPSPPRAALPQENSDEKDRVASRKSLLFRTAKRISISEDEMDPILRIEKRRKESSEVFSKKPMNNFDGVRLSPSRHPTKSLKNVPATSVEGGGFVEKARSFLDSLNSPEENSFDASHSSFARRDSSLAKMPFRFTEEKRIAKNGITSRPSGCPSDERSLWIIWENAVGDVGQGQDSSQVADKDACERICNEMGEECRGFTFYDNDSECEVHDDFDGISFKTSRRRDHSVSTSTKFCFPKEMSVFQNCAKFQGYHESALEIRPREEMNGLPDGFEGMKLCVEACVTTTEFHCKSASFLADEGRCLLNDEDSSSRNGVLEPSLAPNHLYFENGCSRRTRMSAQEVAASAVERIPKDTPEWNFLINRVRSTTPFPERRTEDEMDFPMAAPLRRKPLRALRIQKLASSQLSASTSDVNKAPEEHIVYNGAFMRVL